MLRSVQAKASIKEIKISLQLVRRDIYIGDNVYDAMSITKVCCSFHSRDTFLVDNGA